VLRGNKASSLVHLGVIGLASVRDGLELFEVA
jgi:hypothetical protein